MTFRELRDYLDTLTEKQLGMDVAIEIEGEFYAATSFKITGNADILDEEHPYLGTD